MLRASGISRKLTSLGVGTGAGLRRLQSTASQQQLSWVEFFKLRKQQNYINTVSSVFTALTGSVISWGYISNVEIDPTEMIFGFDPFMIYVGGFLTVSGVGYLFGPSVGNLIFRLKNKSILSKFQAKNKTFLSHIAKNRVDPSSQSFSNPVPDYYGEKINSLKAYRQWLRDCHAYKRKTQEFL